MRPTTGSPNAGRLVSGILATGVAFPIGRSGVVDHADTITRAPTSITLAFGKRGSSGTRHCGR